MYVFKAEGLVLYNQLVSVSWVLVFPIMVVTQEYL